jgi:hypothetical protein
VTRCLAILWLLIAGVIAAPSAIACMWNPPGKQAFWQKPPDLTVPGEVVLDVSLIASVEEVFDPPHEFTTSCDGLTPVVAYRINRVVAGAFSGDIVVAAPDFDMADENFNPMVRRLLVGRIGATRTFTVEYQGENAKPFVAPVIDIRPASGLERDGWRGTERLFFRLAGLLHQQLAGAIGVRGVNAGGSWIGLAIFALIVAVPFGLLALRRKRPALTARNRIVAPCPLRPSGVSALQHTPETGTTP